MGLIPISEGLSLIDMGAGAGVVTGAGTGAVGGTSGKGGFAAWALVSESDELGDVGPVEPTMDNMAEIPLEGRRLANEH